MAPQKPKFEKASFVLSDENVLMSEETVKNRTEVKEADKTPVNSQIHNNIFFKKSEVKIIPAKLTQGLSF